MSNTPNLIRKKVYTLLGISFGIIGVILFAIVLALNINAGHVGFSSISAALIIISAYSIKVAVTQSKQK